MFAMEILTKARLESEPNEREKHNLQIAYKAACESVVLLENNGALPIRVGKIALYGSGARKTVKGGGGGVRVMDGYYIGMKYLNSGQAALLEKLSETLSGDELLTMQSILKTFSKPIK